MTLALGSSVWAEEPPNPPPAAEPLPGVTTDNLVGPVLMHDESLDQVLTMLEALTEMTLLRPQTLPNIQLNLSLKKRVTKAEAIRAIETLLSLNGIAVTALDDSFLKITPLTGAKSEAPELIRGSTLQLPASGRLASKLFRLHFLRASEFTPQFAGMLSSAGGAPAVFERTNAVLVTDSVSNLQRIETLLAQLDVPPETGYQPKFYTLNFAKASDVVGKLHAILSGPLGSQFSAATSYNADERTNQIVLLADPLQQAIFDTLIAQLDVHSGPNARTDYIYLKHASAKEVATTLSQLVAGQNAGGRNSGQENSRAAVQAIVPEASTPGAAVAGLVQSLDAAAQFSSVLTVMAEERSNALIVSGTADDLLLMHRLVERIDIVLSQVRIEVIIAEVTLHDTDTSGISALNLTVGPNAKGATQVTNFAGALAGWSVTNGVVNPAAFSAALGDTGSKNNVRILSTPTIVTTHNKEAEILVGQSQPVITGSQTSPTGSGIASNESVTYKDIAIDLKVTPLIGDDGSIQLKIDQKVDDIVGNVSVNGEPQPIIGRRQATSFINVDDNQMVVLGGLQRTKNTNNRTKLGFLFEIPILSHLLGARDKEVERTELLLFIRPHVIHPKEGTADTVKQIDQMSNKKEVDEFLQPKKPKKPKS